MPEYFRAHRRALLLQVPFSLLLIVLLLWRVDIMEALRRLTSIDLRWVALGLVTFTASKLLHAFRWRVLLSHRTELPTRHLFEVFLLSNLASALIPFRAGDLLRIELPSRTFGVPRAELASSVLLVESVLDGLAFAILFAVTLPFLDVPAALRPLLFGAIAVAVGAFVVTAAAARLGRGGNLARARLLRWLPRRARDAVGRLVPQFIDGMRSLRDMRALLSAIAVSLVAWLAEVAVYWMMGQAFGLQLSLAEALVLMIAANMIVSLPLTPWDVGPYELVVTEAAMLLGVARAPASAFAVGSHLLLQLWIAITGLAAMWSLDLRPRDLLPDGDPLPPEHANPPEVP